MDLDNMEEINHSNLPADLETLFGEVAFGIFNENKKNERFVNVTLEDVDEFLEDEENMNTKRKTSGDINVFSQFLMSMNELRHPEAIDPAELNQYICQFILSVRKKTGGEYEPCTIRAFISSIERYLKKKDYGVSIMTDIQFNKCRETLKSKMKHLKKQGKGNRPRAAAEITDQQIDNMYQKGNLGASNPSSLINSLWLTCTTHFGMRTGQETHDLKWGDITLQNENGEEFLLFCNERQTKTRTGENERNIRQIKPRAYAVPDEPDRDTVFLYKLYSNKRPDTATSEDSPFFLAVNHFRKQDGPWYKSNAMGINSIYAIMKTMKAGTDIENDNRITPYSVRKHLVQKLRDSGLPPTEIIQVTGHKNVNSINNYSGINTIQQKNISKTLSTSNQGQPALSSSHPGQLALTNSRQPSATVTHLPGSPSADFISHCQDRGGSSSYSASHSRNFLSSIMVGSTVHGNVTINVTPEVIGMNRPQPVSATERDTGRSQHNQLSECNAIEAGSRGVKRPLEQ